MTSCFRGRSFPPAPSLPFATNLHVLMSVTVYDDRDALVVYSSSPGWTRGGNVSDFDGTSTWSTSAGASFTFKFTGLYLLHASLPRQCTHSLLS